MPVAELLLASLSVGVALVCFTIAGVLVPRIALPDVRRSVTLFFRVAVAAFSILAGVVNLQIAIRALVSSEQVSAHELALPALQFVGGSLFVLAALRYLDLGLTRKVTVEEHRVRELERLALHDPLTGIHNRRFFDEALRNEIHRHHRYDRPVSVVLFDVDDLKAINDRGGHSAGDRALMHVAATAEDVVRASDSVVRLGGDEFALLLPETDQPRAALVAERLRAAIEELSIPIAGRTSISAGVASLPRDGQTAEELQARADQALYWAKKHGKNRCATASGASGIGTYAA
jgi:diguanylate cyclase (GGDEF)-like protein